MQSNSAEEAQTEFRKKQGEFLRQYMAFLQGAPFELKPESAQVVSQKMMLNTANLISRRNLEDLDDFSEHYILKAE